MKSAKNNELFSIHSVPPQPKVKLWKFGKFKNSKIFNNKDIEFAKKKLLTLSEFTFVTCLGWLDPTVGFWVSLVMLIWHLIQDK
ncbi:MAG TPA: hypothetical protein VK184_11355 [Nostocaceae cyanobacterium]|nr:hypothetical protein [Nostocaceae cyanobacterium]